jgi:hypothetical protein
MQWVNTADLKKWATTRNCQETLPLLVRKLIRATCSSIKNIKFSTGDNIQIGGWDGVLEINEETEFVPLGTSLWEFGANVDVKGKADRDYNKRSENFLGFDPKDCTFVFVTPRLWTNGDSWAEEKNKMGIWKDVKVINAEKLEEWLEVAPSVSEWLAAAHLGKPSTEVESTDIFWEKWVTGPFLKLNPDILLGDRSQEEEKLIKSLDNPTLLAVKSSSREESMAFIVACFKNNTLIGEDFFARSIIVESPKIFKQLIAYGKPLIFIPLFEDDGSFNYAVSKGHNVIIPLGADSSDLWSNIITLKQIGHFSFVTALTKSGLSIESSRKYSKESARNITVLRRQLEFVRNLPQWAHAKNVRDIIPALLVGRWDEDFENDKTIISKLAGESYEDYSKTLIRWLNEPDSPFVRIGSTWRLVSPLDAWVNASKNLTRNDFETISKLFLEVLQEINPQFEWELEERVVVLFDGKKWKYSAWIREGITQSLVLISIYGDKLKLNIPILATTWVDALVWKLLDTENPVLWKSLADILPLIGEASPISFLNAVEKYLPLKISPIAKLIEDEIQFVNLYNRHTGLLPALESLACYPEYLVRAVVMLTQLAAIDPGGSVSNRPLISLTEIFKPWHHQPLGVWGHRTSAIQLIIQKERRIAWALLNNMLPNSYNIVHPTFKMRWRPFDMNLGIPFTNLEISKILTTVIDLLISIFDNSDAELSQLIYKSVELCFSDRDKLLSFIETIKLDQLRENKNRSWNATRLILWGHRSNPDLSWALSEEEVMRYDKIFKLLEPFDEAERVTWMFNESMPKFPEGYNIKALYTNEYLNVINKKRVDGLRTLYEKSGIDVILRLVQSVKDSWIFGNTLAQIFNNETEIHTVCNQLKSENVNLKFVYGFLKRKYFLYGIDWFFELHNSLSNLDFPNSKLIHIFIAIVPSRKLWDFINSLNSEARDEYWKNMQPEFGEFSTKEDLGLQYLLEYKRFAIAIAICSKFGEEISSDIIVDILEKSATKNLNEGFRLQGHEISKLFEILHKRPDVEQPTLLNLALHYLHHLSFRSDRCLKLLHEELANNSLFFYDILKIVHKPEDDVILEEEKAVLNQEELGYRVRNACDLLITWKDIPGVDNCGKIDKIFLNNWIDEARKIAQENSKLEFADQSIGQLLAEYPETSEIKWPPDEICSIIERINTQGIKSQFYVAMYVKKRPSGIALYGGGDRERIIANNFKDLYLQHSSKYPNVAAIFENLSKEYEQIAKTEDERTMRDSLEY